MDLLHERMSYLHSFLFLFFCTLDFMLQPIMKPRSSYNHVCQSHFYLDSTNSIWFCDKSHVHVAPNVYSRLISRSTAQITRSGFSPTPASPTSFSRLSRFSSESTKLYIYCGFHFAFQILPLPSPHWPLPLYLSIPTWTRVRALATTGAAAGGAALLLPLRLLHHTLPTSHLHFSFPFSSLSPFPTNAAAGAAAAVRPVVGAAVREGPHSLLPLPHPLCGLLNAVLYWQLVLLCSMKP